jgi:hypothetical protein
MHKIISELEEIAEKARNAFGHLSPKQINWKPSAESWSVGQCFEHLIKINSAYFPEFESIIKGDKEQKFWEHYSPFSGLFGNLLFKALSPEAKRKLKAPKVARPAASNISPAVIADFVKHQAELIDKIRHTEKLDTRKIIITSPFIKAITYSLFDAYRIIVTHEKRHFEQAQRVVQAGGFPRQELS